MRCLAAGLVILAQAIFALHGASSADLPEHDFEACEICQLSERCQAAEPPSPVIPNIHFATVSHAPTRAAAAVAIFSYGDYHPRAPPLI